MIAGLIPIVDQRAASRMPLILAHVLSPGGTLADTRGRLLRDLRISVTDRCNFRCTYCMPKAVFDGDYRFLPRTELLSFEEITRMARLFAAHGVEKIRLTGGEPLLRKNIEALIEMLAALKTHDGKSLDLTLTTNASLLSRKAKSLKAAGLQRVSVSLDSLDEAVFRAMNDVDFPVADVLKGIDAAHDPQAGRKGFTLQTLPVCDKPFGDAVGAVAGFRHTPRSTQAAIDAERGRGGFVGRWKSHGKRMQGRWIFRLQWRSRARFHGGARAEGPPKPVRYPLTTDEMGVYSSYAPDNY